MTGKLISQLNPLTEKLLFPFTFWKGSARTLKDLFKRIYL